jgi:hypothetical protein
MFKEAVCRYLYPNCSITSTGNVERAEMCYSSCARLIHDCGKNLLYMIALVQAKFPDLWDNFNPVNVHLEDLACDREVLNSKQSSSCLTLIGSIGEVEVSTCEARGTNSLCTLPFIYSNVEYDGCIFVNTTSNWRPWCRQKQINAGQGSNEWGYCDCRNNSLSKACELYSGSPVCEEYLRGTNVFVDNAFSQTYLGNLINQFKKSFYEKHSSGCVGPSVKALCHLLFPECNSLDSNTSPLPFCYNSCTLLSNGRCGSEFSEMMQTVITYFESHSVNPIHFSFSSSQSICSQLPRKSSLSEICADIHIDVLPPASDNDKVVAISVVTPISCIVLCIVVVVFWKWKTRKHTTALHSLDMSEVYVDVGGEPLKMGIEWDDDILHSVLESMINGKRLKISEQIGEGRTHHSLPNCNIYTIYR